jgi:putative protein-disulfide isomerase
MSSKKNTLILVTDPLCGWCYGFGPVMNQLFEKYHDRLNFDVISGGMITGKRIGPLSNMRDFIRQAYKRVEQTTGVKFGQAFLEKTLEEGTATFSSLEPSKALTIFRSFQPDKVVEFGHEIQKLIYFDGINPVQVDAYMPLFARYGLQQKQILPLFNSKETEQETINEFGRAARWGISGFPACVMQLHSGKAFLLSNGYLPYEEMEEKIMQYLG